jgi:hypothetical protein
MDNIGELRIDNGKEEIVKLRENQSQGSRLCELLTGMKPDDNRITDRLREDQKIVRQKYSFPENRKVCVVNPAEYIDMLKKTAIREKVSIRNKNEFGNFFEEHGAAGAVYSEENNSIGVNISYESKIDLRKSAQMLEHELIHALQKKYYPEMPVEIMEYEAYLSSWNIDFLEEKPDVIHDIFSFYVYGSVNFNYSEKGLKPEWDNPRWFLKHVDKIEE